MVLIIVAVVDMELIGTAVPVIEPLKLLVMGGVSTNESNLPESSCRANDGAVLAL